MKKVIWTYISSFITTIFVILFLGWLMAREAGAAVNAYDRGCLSNNKCDIFVGATEQIRLDLAEANAVQHD